MTSSKIEPPYEAPSPSEASSEDDDESRERSLPGRYRKPEPRLYGHIRPSLLGSPPNPP